MPYTNAMNISGTVGQVITVQPDGSLECQILPTATPRSQASASRALNTIFQVSSTRDSIVGYSVDILCSFTLLAGQQGTVYLEISASPTFASGVQEVSRYVNGNAGVLLVGINLIQNCTAGLNGYVPAGYYVRLRTQNNLNTPTFNYRSGQEVLL